MSDPLATLFELFLKERVFLKDVTPQTRVWYESAWRAFNASQTAAGDGLFTKARLQAFVVHVRSRGISLTPEAKRHGSGPPGCTLRPICSRTHLPQSILSEN